MDRCLCWKGTRIIITIQHCPSMEKEVAVEVDRIIQYTMKQTDLPQFGRVTINGDKVEGPKE